LRHVSIKTFNECFELYSDALYFFRLLFFFKLLSLCRLLSLLRLLLFLLIIASSLSTKNRDKSTNECWIRWYFMQNVFKSRENRLFKSIDIFIYLQLSSLKWRIFFNSYIFSCNFVWIVLRKFVLTSCFRVCQLMYSSIK
jgi:hypothetical protein